MNIFLQNILTEKLNTNKPELSDLKPIRDITILNNSRVRGNVRMICNRVLTPLDIDLKIKKLLSIKFPI